MTSQIATLDELKSLLSTSRTSDDDALQMVLDAVSDRVESYTGRLFHPVPALDGTGEDTLPAVTKTVYLPRRLLRLMYDPYAAGLRPRQRIVDVPEARSIDSVTMQAAAIDSYLPLDPREDGAPFERLQLLGLTIPPQYPLEQLPAVQVTGRFGWWPAPPRLKDAVLTMAARRWKERDAVYGDTVQLAEGITVSYYRQFPATVQATIEGLMRRTITLP